MRQKNIIQELNNFPSRVYLMCFTYAVGGGDTLFIRFAEYLLRCTNIKVGIIDFSDGIMTRTAKKFFHNENIHYISYENSEWNLENNSCIFVPGDMIGCIKNIKTLSVRIAVYHWSPDIGWNFLFEEKTFRKLGKLLKSTNACSFTDFGCYAYVKKDFHQEFKKHYIPLFFHIKNNENFKYKNSSDEINAVILGRLSNAKTFTVMNIAENFYRYKTHKKKILHIIGNGIDQQFLKEEFKKYTDEMDIIFTGVITGDALYDYLKKHTDIGFAMGTSLLNFASLHLPVVAAHVPLKRFFSDEFQWFYNLYEYCLGSPLEREEEFLPMFTKISNFADMLDDISLHGKGKEYGELCFEYYQKHHANLTFVGEKLLEAISKTTLTYSALKKILRYMPYDTGNGVYIENIYFFKIHIMKIIHFRNKRKYYLFGIKFFHVEHRENLSLYRIFGITFINIKKTGRYSFDCITSDTIKKQCRNKYSINEKIFD